MMKTRTWFAAAIVAACSSTTVITGDAQPPKDPAARAAIRRNLYTELQPVRLANCKMERYGEPNDGGYLVCANLLKAVQAGYSYGISGYDGWGCEVSRKLKVRVHQYDCFDLRQPACPSGATIFHPECVAGAPEKQDGKVFDTLASQFKKNGDAGKRLVMKIDVEAAEWDSFAAAPDSVFEQIDQLVVEFHYTEEARFVDIVRRLKRFYYVAHLHFNNFSCHDSIMPFPSWAYEVLFVNKRIATLGSGPAGRLLPLDAPNNPSRPDCQSAPSSRAPAKGRAANVGSSR